MSRKIKVFSGLMVVLFSLASMFIFLLRVWEVIDAVEAKDNFIKLAYTFAGAFAISLIVLLAVSTLDKKE